MVGAQGLVAQQGGVEGAVHGGSVIAPVLDQLGIGLDTEPVEQRERCRTQQLREPAVKGADLDRSSRREHAGLKRAELGRERLGTRRIDAAIDEWRARVVHGSSAASRNSASHWSSRSRISPAAARRERDRQDLVRRRPIEERAQHARDQHPGLARAGTRLDDARTRRVAGGGVERRRIDAPAVDTQRRRVTRHRRSGPNGRAGKGRVHGSSRMRCPRRARAGRRRRAGRFISSAMPATRVRASSATR
jgi:hypothetical protein